MSPTSRCVILVPVGGAIEPGCEDGLRELERRGYRVCRVRGYSTVDAARNQMASDALAQRFNELMWMAAVNLDNASGTTLLSTTTDASGDYSFSVSSQLLTQYSSFEIQVVIPNGDAATVEYAGGGGLNSNINGTGYSNVFSLIADGNQTVNGGLVAQNGSGSGPATVNGEVWLDSNGNGLLDNGEAGDSGVTVNLDNASGTLLQSATTNANGNYSFSVSSQLLTQYSSFEIQVVIPNGDAATVENAGGGGINSNINGTGYSNVFSLIADGNQTVNGGLVAQNGSGSGPATVNGEVWLDSNGDGLLDNSEAGVSGVTVNLDNASGQVVQSTATNSSGDYSFRVSTPSLSNGYQIQVVIPSDDAATIENAAGAGINSNIDTQGDSGVFFLYAGGTQTINAGLASDPVVSGEVWLDSNADGLLDNGETGAAGVTVYLDNSQGTPLLTTTTNASGNYQFIVPPSQLGQSGYEVQVAFPSGQMATLENVSGSGINSNINASGFSKVFSLSLNGSQQINAGLASDPVVSGAVWLDSNADGLLDNGESGMSGVTVYLDNASGTTLMSATTDASGNYQFIVPPSAFVQGSGGFEIQVVFPSGDMATIENASGSGINSNIDTSGYSNVFGLAPAGKQQVNAGLAPDPVVSGEVWLDSDGDGLLDNSESGLSGVTVNLDNAAGTTLMSTTTDASGDYLFTVTPSVFGQGSGGFEIQVVFPSGDMATLENVSGSGIDSNIDTSGYSNVFSLAPAGKQQINAGLAPDPVVSGEVWFDSNADGLLDNGESGMSAITVNLDNAAGTTLMSATTNASGNYQFSVPQSVLNQAGSGSGSGFEIQVVLPSGDTATLENVSGSGINSNIGSGGYSDVFGLAPAATQTVNAGLAAEATVKGEVWLDSNGDGLLDNGEAGQSDVIVYLDNAQGTQLLSTITDANGNYQFTVPVASSSSGSGSGMGSGSSSGYEIQVVIPDDEVATRENVYGSGINSEINNYGDSAVFYLFPGGTQQVNAGLAPAPVVSGEVWLDSNGNGLLDTGESGLSGITVNLDDAQGEMLMSTTTDANGNYQFSVSQSVLNQANSGSGSGMGSGLEIQVVIPSGDSATLENVSGSGINSNIGSGGYSNVFWLTPGGTQKVNAGLAPQAVVSGEVWFDSDGDGLLDNGESGLSGVTVNLDNAAGEVLQTMTTGANGQYLFTLSPSQLQQGSGLGSGSGFKVQVVIPVGDTATIENASASGINSNISSSGFSNVFALSPVANQQVNGGIVPQSGSGSGSGSGATVSGEVWLDSNGDGLLDNGESGMSGITVNLDTAQGTTLMTTVTDANGNYQFNVPQSLINLYSGSGSGNFEIQVLIPNGDSATFENVSGPDTDSNINANGFSNLFSLTGGGNEPDSVANFAPMLQAKRPQLNAGVVRVATDPLIWNPQNGSDDAADKSNWLDDAFGGNKGLQVQGVTAPGPKNPVIFDGGESNAACDWKQNVTVASITLRNGYTGQWALNQGSTVTDASTIIEDGASSLNITFGLSIRGAGDRLIVQSGTSTLTNFNFSNGTGAFELQGPAWVDLGANYSEKSTAYFEVDNGATLSISGTGAGLQFVRVPGGVVEYPGIVINAGGNLRLDGTLGGTLVTAGGQGSIIENNGTVRFWTNPGITATLKIPVLDANASVFYASGGGNAESQGGTLKIAATDPRTNNADFDMTGGMLSLSEGVILNLPDGYLQSGGILTTADTFHETLDAGIAGISGGKIALQYDDGPFDGGGNLEIDTKQVDFSGGEYDPRINGGSSGSSDVLTIAGTGGNLNLQGATMTVTVEGSVGVGIWPIIKYTGRLTGKFKNPNLNGTKVMYYRTKTELSN